MSDCIHISACRMVHKSAKESGVMLHITCNEECPEYISEQTMKKAVDDLIFAGESESAKDIIQQWVKGKDRHTAQCLTPLLYRSVDWTGKHFIDTLKKVSEGNYDT